MILTNDNNDSRRMVEQCYKRSKTLVNPIIDWSDREVWDFIHAEHIPYCGLYDEGMHRLGCIGCPMAGREMRAKNFVRWPKYKQAYLSSFERMIEERRRKGRPAWRSTGGAAIRREGWRYGSVDHEEATARDVFRWWMEQDSVIGQMEIEDLLKEQEQEEQDV